MAIIEGKYGSKGIKRKSLFIQGMNIDSSPNQYEVDEKIENKNSKNLESPK